MTNKIDLNDDNISKILNDTSKITQIIQAGINLALLKHKQAGHSVCEWQEDKVVWILPEKIPNRIKK